MRKNYHEEDYFEDDTEIDLIDLIFTLLRRWKIIVLIAVPIIILGFCYAMTRPNIYRAQTTLIVSNSPTGISVNSGDIYVNQKLVVTYSQLAKSRDVMARVIQKYDLQESLGSMAAKINVSPVEETELIKLSYTNGDPRIVEAVTNELANEFIKKVSQVMKVRNVSVVERALEPSAPLPKRRGVIILASIILGGMGGMGIAFLIEMIHSKVRKSSDIEKILGAKMLGMIPEITTEEEKGEKSYES